MWNCSIEKCGVRTLTVERSRHGHPTAGGRKPFGEFEADRAVVEATVDMRGLDRDELVGVTGVRQGNDDSHRDRHSIAALAGEYLALVGRQSDLVAGRAHRTQSDKRHPRA